MCSSDSVFAALLIINAVVARNEAFDVDVNIGAAHASTVVSSLTSVTMDICVAKQRFPFDDKDLLALTSHLGGGDSILRIGGSDQNSFYYNINSTRDEPFSAANGGPCCEHHGSCHGCVHDCTMPGPYWKSIHDFAKASGHKLMFGLVPDLEQASSIIKYSAAQNMSVFAYTYGNEIESSKITYAYPALRKLLDTTFTDNNTAPKLAGPDTYVQRNYRYTLNQALADQDPTITAHLAFISEFTEAAGTTLDALSWHTYDFETPMIGMTDHQDLRVNALMSRLWSSKHLDFAIRLLGNITRVARKSAPNAEVWLSEGNSICHQGINGVTNAYLNSVWLLNRLGIAANANLSVMARQSLIGYNYSLLGNWPVEPIFPNPDYFTTVLFRRLFGNIVLATQAIPHPLGPPATNITEGGDRARAFAFCTPNTVQWASSGSVSIALLNFDPRESAIFTFNTSLGIHHDYVLSPGQQPIDKRVPWSSREMLLNDVLLTMSGPDWDLPEVVTGIGKINSGDILLKPLHVGLTVFPKAGNEDCM